MINVGRLRTSEGSNRTARGRIAGRSLESSTFTFHIDAGSGESLPVLGVFTWTPG